MAHFIFALALLMHGIGHALFVANGWGYWRTDTGQGWLFGRNLHAGPTVEGMAGLLWLVPLVGFLVGAWSFYMHAPGWQAWLLGASLVSTAMLLLFWGSINGSSALFALLFNVIVMAVVLWRPEALLGQ